MLSHADCRYLVLVEAWEETPLYEMLWTYEGLPESRLPEYKVQKEAALLDNLNDGLVQIYGARDDREPLALHEACELLKNGIPSEVDVDGPHLAVTHLGIKTFKTKPFGLTYKRREDLIWGHSDAVVEGLQTEHPPTFSPYTKERPSLLSSIKRLLRRNS